MAYYPWLQAQPKATISETIHIPVSPPSLPNKSPDALLCCVCVYLFINATSIQGTHAKLVKHQQGNTDHEVQLLDG
jgi:hypothetical protein